MSYNDVGHDEKMVLKNVGCLNLFYSLIFTIFIEMMPTVGILIGKNLDRFTIFSEFYDDAQSAVTCK